MRSRDMRKYSADFSTQINLAMFNKEIVFTSRNKENTRRAFACHKLTKTPEQRQ